MAAAGIEKETAVLQTAIYCPECPVVLKMMLYPGSAKEYNKTNIKNLF